MKSRCMTSIQKMLYRGYIYDSSPYKETILVYTRKRDNQQRERIETDGITIRADKRMLQALKKEAREKQISTNILVSKIFRRHLDWHSNAARAGFIPVRRGTMTKLLENVSDEEVARIARFITSRESKDYVLLLRDEYNLSTALDVMEIWMRFSGYKFKHGIRSGTHTLVIQHEMGKKWSVYISESYRCIFEEFGQMDSKFSLTDNTVQISFEERQM